ncbi:MAG: DUF192 domain-containing protein [bacterium]|nr:DUF192 domain-containing protein [bacterium]
MVHLVVRYAGGFEKVKGLIGSDVAEAILIKTRFGIHTFGLQFPIDIIVLDKHGIVQVIKHSFHPNGIFLWPIKYDRVLELPEGMIREKGIKKGEKITITLKQSAIVS